VVQGVHPRGEGERLSIMEKTVYILKNVRRFPKFDKMNCVDLKITYVDQNFTSTTNTRNEENIFSKTFYVKTNSASSSK
jgi:hypothetical protein